MEVELGVDKEEEEMKMHFNSELKVVIPPFMKGQSHAVGRRRKQGRSEKKRGKRSRNLSPAELSIGPNSTIHGQRQQAQLPEEISKFYKDLSSSSGDSLNEHLFKLKVLFKDSQL